MPKIHVLLTHQELDAARLGGKVVVVLDVLFATTTVVHALAAGATGIRPVRTREDAVHRANQLAPGLRVLAGEHLGQSIPEFAPATPLALTATGINDCEIVYCTSNGTQALMAVSGAVAVYVGALLNGHALARHLIAQHPHSTLLIVCAGSLGRFNLEDFHAAGHLIEHLVDGAEYALTDSAIAALHAFRGCDTATALRESRVGRILLQHHLDDELDLATRKDSLAVVPVMRDGRVTQVAA
jgi:2-phosphosulfolactate phosphatase